MTILFHRFYKFGLLIPALLFCYSCTGSKSKEPQVKTTDTINDQQDSVAKDTIHSATAIQFGFANESGNQILIDSTIFPLKPELLVYTIDTSGRPVNIKYEKYHPATAKDNHRQTCFNFNNAGGYLFSVKNKMADQSNTSILFTQNFYSDHTVINMSEPTDNSFPDQIRKKTESDKKRKVKSFKALKLLEGGRSIYLIEFAKKKDSVLVSLVLTGIDQAVYYDFPAIYNEQSTWRVDDGGEFGFEYFSILAAFKVNGKIEIITDWIGAEGYNTLYLKEDGSNFIKIKEYYRYSSPE